MWHNRKWFTLCQRLWRQQTWNQGKNTWLFCKIIKVLTEYFKWCLMLRHVCESTLRQTLHVCISNIIHKRLKTSDSMTLCVIVCCQTKHHYKWPDKQDKVLPLNVTNSTMCNACLRHDGSTLRWPPSWIWCLKTMHNYQPCSKSLSSCLEINDKLFPIYL